MDKTKKLFKKMWRVPAERLCLLMWPVTTIVTSFWFAFHNINQFNLFWEIPLAIIAGFLGMLIGAPIITVLAVIIPLLLLFISWLFIPIATITNDIDLLLRLREVGDFLKKITYWFLKGEERPF